MTAFAGGNGAAIFSTMPEAMDLSDADQPLKKGVSRPLPDCDPRQCAAARRIQCRA